MKKMISLMMALLISASVGLFSSCAEKPCAHSFGEWETVKEASCIAGEKQRVCENCDFTETEEISALDDFLAHSFNENTLCTSCGHQEFIESEEYIEEITIPLQSVHLGSNASLPGILWWNKDKTYALRISVGNPSCLMLDGYVGNPVHVRLPAYYNNCPLGYIGVVLDEEPEIFKNCTTLKSIYIPDTVTRIEDYAFDGCTALESIRFSENLNWIEFKAFNNCTSLKTLDFKNNKNTLTFGNENFANCTSLTEIYFPSNQICWTSGDSCVKNCTALEKIYISEERHDYFTKQFIPYYPNLQIISYE